MASSRNMRRLSVLLWQDRLRLAIPTLVVLLLFAGLLALYILDSDIAEQSVVEGTVDGWSREQKETGAGAYLISVTLADGNKALATAGSSRDAPRLGQHVKLMRIKTRMGRIRYRWTG